MEVKKGGEVLLPLLTKVSEFRFVLGFLTDPKIITFIIYFKNPRVLHRAR